MAASRTTSWTLRTPCLALLLSLAAHGALAAALALLPVPVDAGRPAVESRFVVDDIRPALELTFLPPSQPVRPRNPVVRTPGLSAEDRDGGVDYSVRVVDPSGASVTAPPAPVVVARPAASEVTGPGATAVPRSARAVSTGRSGAPGAGSDKPGTGVGGALPALPLSATRVVYVLDRSISMGQGGALGTACRQVLASLRALPHGSVFQIVLFNGLAEPLRLGDRPAVLLPADEATLREVEASFRWLQATGTTRPAEALRRGLRFRPQVIYFLTDADDLAPQEVTRLSRETLGRTVIHAVELSDRAAAQLGPLGELAAATGGTYRRLPRGR